MRLLQTHDASGAEVASDTVYTMHYQGLRSIVETTLEVFAGYNLVSTPNPGVYAYNAPGVGSGWLRLERFSPTDVETADNLVRTREIGRSIGQQDPWRNEELGIGTAVVNRTSNPYIQIALGLATVVLGIFCVLYAVSGAGKSGPAANVVLAIVGVPIAGVGVALAIRGIRRRAWWVAARAEARRRGEKLPDQLKVWN